MKTCNADLFKNDSSNMLLNTVKCVIDATNVEEKQGVNDNPKLRYDVKENDQKTSHRYDTIKQAEHVTAICRCENNTRDCEIHIDKLCKIQECFKESLTH